MALGVPGQGSSRGVLGGSAAQDARYSALEIVPPKTLDLGGFAVVECAAIEETAGAVRPAFNREETEEFVSGCDLGLPPSADRIYGGGFDSRSLHPQ